MKTWIATVLVWAVLCVAGCASRPEYAYLKVVSGSSATVVVPDGFSYLYANAGKTANMNIVAGTYPLKRESQPPPLV